MSWASLNPKVATADDQGVARALMSGQATIAADVDGVVGSGVLTVSVPSVQPVTSWTASWKGPVLEGVWGASPEEVFAVGTEGTILHFDGARWEPMTSGSESHLAAVWGTSSTDVYAVGEAGTVLHYDGTAWSQMTAPTLAELRGVWGSSLGEVTVVGLYGAVLRGRR